MSATSSITMRAPPGPASPGAGSRDLGKRGAAAPPARQEVARLAVGGGDRERAGVLLRELLADALEVADLAHDDLDGLEHLRAGLGDAAQALAVAGEDVDAEFVLQLEDGLEMPGCEVNSTLAVSVRFRFGGPPPGRSGTGAGSWARFIRCAGPCAAAAIAAITASSRRPCGAAATARRDAAAAGARPAAADPCAHGRRRRGTAARRRRACSRRRERIARLDDAGCHEIEEGERHRAPRRAARGSARRRPRTAAPSSGRARHGRNRSRPRLIDTSRPARPPATPAGTALGAAAVIQGVQSRSRPRWPAMLLSSTKEMPSMMPPNTLRLTPPARHAGRRRGASAIITRQAKGYSAFPELDLVTLRRLLVVVQVADVAEQLDRRHGRQRQSGRHHAGRRGELPASQRRRASPRWPRRGRRRRLGPARHASSSSCQVSLSPMLAAPR